VKVVTLVASLTLSVCALGAGAAPALAQVGYPPTKSPYQDVSIHQDIAAYGGWFSGSEGQAGVGPRSGTILGVRYGLRIGGPVDFVGHLARVSSDRLVLDPSLSGDARRLGTQGEPLYLADVGIAVNLTGQKSYHRLMPTAGFGLGLVTGRGGADIGGYQFGTGFAIQFGAGVRYIASNNVSVRLDLADYLWQLAYPSTYYTHPAAGGDPILAANAPTNEWTHNKTITLGISYILSR
jgi:opacity protein-like surface antigen